MYIFALFIPKETEQKRGLKKRIRSGRWEIKRMELVLVWYEYHFLFISSKFYPFCVFRIILTLPKNFLTCEHCEVQAITANAHLPSF